MYIHNNADFAPRDFIVCDFYGVETCFCWNANDLKLLVFPYEAGSSSAHNIRVFSTPAPIQQIQCFDGRVFVLCAPQGVYKLARSGVFALLSTSALGMGAEFYEVLVARENDIHLDNKQTKDSRLLFKYTDTSDMTNDSVWLSGELHSLSLIPTNTEEQFFECLMGNQQEERNICIIGYDRKLFTWTGDTVHLIYVNMAGTISRIAPVIRKDKVAGVLLLINMDTVILMHSRNRNLVYQKVWLKRDVQHTSTLCAGFSSELENILWILYCDQSTLYYIEKELLTDNVQERRVNEKTFTCIQYYKSNVILGLLHSRELVELSVETLKNPLSINNNIKLHDDMFLNTDTIMESIYDRAKKLDKLYKELTNEQDKLRRINMYAHNQKIEVNPQIEMCRLWNHCYLALNISEKLLKNSHIVFAFNSEYQNSFCVKKVTEATCTIKMPINENKVLYSSTINMDLITLTNKGTPWCIIQNFIHSPPQKETRTRASKKEKDKTAFIEAKIALLRNLIADKDLSITKLSEIKKIIRAELSI